MCYLLGKVVETSVLCQQYILNLSSLFNISFICWALIKSTVKCRVVTFCKLSCFHKMQVNFCIILSLCGAAIISVIKTRCLR